MNSVDLLALFRVEVDDKETPFLWADALIYGYMDEAQKRFCRDSYGIADARSFTIPILANGTEWYDLEPSVLKIREATDSVTGRAVPLIAVEKMPGLGMYFDGVAGPIKALITGLEEGMLRAWPKPNRASTVNLSVFRISDDMPPRGAFTIGAQHQRNLLYWVKYRAYGVQDSEAYDKDASADNLAKHVAYCAKALVEQSRVLHSAGTVAYGGI